MILIEMIHKLEDAKMELEPKKIKKLHVQQFINLLSVLSDRDLLDGSSLSKEMEASLLDIHQQFIGICEDIYGDRSKVKVLRKAYNELLAKVRKSYDLQPEGSIQATYTGVGIALGSGVGTALMATAGPAFMSIGISLGLVFGVAVGSQKEKEAKLAGRLF